MEEKNIYQLQIDNLTKTIDKLDASVIAVHKKLDDLSSTYVTKQELTDALITRDSEISDLKSNQRWVVRTVIGLIIVALVGVIIKN